MSRAVQATDAEARKWRRNVERNAAPQPTPADPLLAALDRALADTRALQRGAGTPYELAFQNGVEHGLKWARLLIARQEETHE